MCLGQFSPADARCINWDREQCFWCGQVLSADTWTSEIASTYHADYCPMRTQWLDLPCAEAESLVSIAAAKIRGEPCQ